MVVQLQLFSLGFCCLGFCDVAVFGHLVQNDFLTGFAVFRIFKRIIIVRTFRDSCQCGGFCQIDVLNVLAEIIEGSAFNTIGALPEVDPVQVHVKDFVFGIAFFQLLGNKSFFYLAGDSTFLRKESVFSQLLGNRTAALHLAAAQVGP